MEKPKERLTGLDADGYIISTEEATILQQDLLVKRKRNLLGCTS